MKIKYCEVVFPLKIDALTYSVPEGIDISPGLPVEAPLRGRVQKGIVVRIKDDSPDIPENVLSIKRVLMRKQILSEPLLRLLKWMSEYYFVEEGLVLRSMLPSFLLKKDLKEMEDSFVNNPEGDISYSTFYFRGDIISDEDFKRMLYQLPCAIIIAPGYDEVKRIYNILLPSFKERLCQFHSRLKASELRRVYIEIISGKYNLILGMRSAIFLPVRPSVIVVTEESSFSYRSKRIPKFNIRDISVMRAYIEDIPVVLTSRIPSIETLFNIKTGKYRVLKGLDPERRDIIPEQRNDVIFRRLTESKDTSIRIIRIKGSASLTNELREEIYRTVSKSGRVLIVLPRYGYSLIYCGDCDGLQRCSCGGFYIFFKEENILRCSRCGGKRGVINTCYRCGGYKLEFRGSGIEKIMEEINSIKDLNASIKKGSDDLDINILIRARGAVKGDYNLGVILDADIYLNIPDYRAEERLFHEVITLTDRLKRGGKIIIQTRMPELKVFSYIKKLNFKDFSYDELKKRKEMLYPPFSRFISLSIRLKKDISFETIKNEIIKRGAEILNFNTDDGRMNFLLRLKRGVDPNMLCDYFRSLRQKKWEVLCDTEPWV